MPQQYVRETKAAQKTDYFRFPLMMVAFTVFVSDAGFSSSFLFLRNRTVKKNKNKYMCKICCGIFISVLNFQTDLNWKCNFHRTEDRRFGDWISHFIFRSKCLMMFLTGASTSTEEELTEGKVRELQERVKIRLVKTTQLFLYTSSI